MQSWRSYYCDTEDTWLECARYEVALTGSPVPISLLPNGKTAGDLDREVERRRQQRSASARSGDPYRTRRSAPAAPTRATTDQLRPGHVPGRPPAPVHHQPEARKRGWWQRVVDWMRGEA